LPAFERPAEASRLFVDYVTLGVTAHLAHRYGGIGEAERHGGLAGWQLRRALELIDAEASGDLSLAALARECRLSASHFARAFRLSTGVAPHQWLLRRRIEKAQHLLASTGEPLSEVAARTGFADQSHFTRTFARLVGVPPGAWRRRR
jgi:AraC-like DNA-binding protein